ncbi:sensor histidine kinase [Mesorhizobium sp. B2-5-13]|uniref:sensor histidine kinase n=1 Tax=unclassified Mesorhizobium TaxID=325217 RepID=UPI00112EEE75|nr:MULTISPECIES: ATP-binding protein [unclassified Mesorhizobium]TPJ38808.1 sensor histidine kinase [Mesorhizobium sp. B2-6-5]TPJ79514.1 sensor histidine kinase [Mesorhizobium sp. B2-5-13]TPK46333.1 sensor histidine kinase [Mesorhizobium sp. B2-5-5]
MNGRTSLVRRLVVAISAVMVVYGLVAAIAGGITLHREINEAMDVAMREAARRLLPVVVDDLIGKDAQAAPRVFAEADNDEDGDRLVVQVRDKQGLVLLHSNHAPSSPLSLIPVPGFTENKGWRIYTEAAVSGTIFIQIAELESRRDEETLEAAFGFLLPLVLLTPLAAIVCWLILERSLRPVLTLRSEIANRHGDNLASIRTEDLPLELAAIAKSVNSLMRRLGMALSAEREFTANAAHELRTPIAGALAQAERLLAEAPDLNVGNRARQIRASLANLARLSEKLMQLARADAGVAAASQPVDLGSVAALVVEEFGRSAGGQGEIDLVRPSEDAPMVEIDQDALAIVIRNLVENAVRHGASGKPVKISIGKDASLRVINECPVIPAAELGGLTQRFARRASPADGSGLGLAIVSNIVQQVGGTLILRSPASGMRDGFEASIQLVKSG